MAMEPCGCTILNLEKEVDGLDWYIRETHSLLLQMYREQERCVFDDTVIETHFLSVLYKNFKMSCGCLNKPVVVASIHNIVFKGK